MLLISSRDVGDAIPYNIPFSVWDFIDSLQNPWETTDSLFVRTAVTKEEKYCINIFLLIWNLKLFGVLLFNVIARECNDRGNPLLLKP